MGGLLPDIAGLQEAAMEEKREALQGLKIRSAESTVLVLMGGGGNGEHQEDTY